MRRVGPMNPVLVALASSALLAACASPPLQREGASAADYRNELQSCEDTALQKVPPGDPSMSDAVSIENEHAMRRRGMAVACMRSKGWK